MKRVTTALFAALVTALLSAAVTAQTLRSPQDPRNQAPTVGTGGPVGGPTGLFTIYDGDTIRKGEFTFSVAYSNYDRDPGNVDLVETPLSFNVGLNDHVELFFKTTGYRGIKVNNPQNLSSFYLPNSQLFFGATLLCSGAAIILAPERVSGTQNISGSVFRPAGPPCNVGGQPFRQFPFIGATGPNFGLTGNNIAPPFVSRIGTPFGGNGSFGAASNFPGMGSPVGSILPGIVFSTRVIPPNLTFAALTVPDVFTISPSYLPDAPFINRLYGESSFTDYVVGAKIRLASPNDALGWGFIPFYRWYPDKADAFPGFNQLQRGASPGANIGDFGLIGFIDGRLSQHWTVSANLGYILNSNPKSKAMGDAVLLDRPDELLSGVAVDYTVNKHFQLIAEARSTMYVGGQTPNAFHNNPVDALGGVRIYPARWWGIGVAYRRHMNQQDQGHFNTAFPRGVPASDDPNGFIFQFWAGHRNPRIINLPPTVYISPPTGSITLPCPEGQIDESCSPSASNTIQLTANASDPDGDPLLYTWTVNGGTKSADAQSITWTLPAGTYEAKVTVDDGHGHIVTSTVATVKVARCPNCHVPEHVCQTPPTVSVSCPTDVKEGTPITFTATASPDVTYEWSVTNGTISSGQSSSSITVSSSGLGGQSVTATVTVRSADSTCPPASASCTTPVGQVYSCKKLDEYDDLHFDDEKARLSHLSTEVIASPGSKAYIIAYGTCEGNGLCTNNSCIVAQKRLERAMKYWTNPRGPDGLGMDADSLVIINGGCRSEVAVELWVCPLGADPLPKASTDNTVPCPDCKPKRPVYHPRRRHRGRDE